MTRLMISEWRKLTSTKLVVGLFAAGAALALLVTWLTLWGPPVGEVQVEGMPDDPLGTASDLRALVEVVGALNVFALVLGVLVVTGEFRHRTAAATFLAEPHRVRVLLAKTFVAAGTGAAYALAGVALVLAVTGIYALGADGSLPLEGTVLRSIGLLAGSSALAAGLGVGIGAAARSQIAAVVGVLVWMFLGETLVGSFLPDVAPWLPFGAGSGMFAGVEGGPSSSVATLVSVGYVGVAMAAGAVRLRQDVV